MLVIAPFIELINKAMRLNTYVALSAVDLSRHPVFGTRVLPESLAPLRLNHCFSKLKLVIMASNHNQNKSLEWKYLCAQAILCESGIEPKIRIMDELGETSQKLTEKQMRRKLNKLPDPLPSEQQVF